MLFRGPKNLHNAGQLLLLVLAREDGDTRVEFGQNAAKTPHVNWQAIRHAENDFGRSVESGLDICVDLLVFKTAGAKIDDLEFGMQRVPQKNILGLEITVNDLLLLQQVQRAEHLFCEAPDHFEGKATESIGLDKFVEVHVE